MKHTKIFLILAMLFALLMDSCDVHEFPDVETPEPPVPEKPDIEMEITLTGFEWPELTTIQWDQGATTRLLSRSGSRAETHKMRFTVNIYDDYTDSRYPSRNLQSVRTWVTDVPQSLGDVMERVGLDLAAGDYIAVAWIDYVDASNPGADLYYDTGDFASISILGDDYPGNCHQREAFRGATRFVITEEGNVVDTESRATIEVIPVVAERPMARYEFVTTDLDEFIKNNIMPASISGGDPNLAPGDSSQAPGVNTPDLDDYIVHMRYTSYLPTTYNCHTNRPVDARTGVSYFGQIVKKTDNEATLAFDHVFVNGSETTVQVALDVYSSTSGNLLASTNPITVPLQRNRHTFVKGKFLTTKASGGASIDTEFDGEFNIEIK